MRAAGAARTASRVRDRRQGARVVLERVMFGLAPLVLLGVLLRMALTNPWVVLRSRDGGGLQLDGRASAKALMLAHYS